jgi:hypothetical protein
MARVGFKGWWVRAGRAGLPLLLAGLVPRGPAGRSGIDGRQTRLPTPPPPPAPQGVSDAFAVDVYETHGRVALETGDGAEFRQCLAVLRRLYARGLPGSAAEFAAYGILAAAGHGHRILAHELAGAGPALLCEPAVVHALEAARAAR